MNCFQCCQLLPMLNNWGCTHHTCRGCQSQCEWTHTEQSSISDSTSASSPSSSSSLSRSSKNQPPSTWTGTWCNYLEKPHFINTIYTLIWNQMYPTIHNKAIVYLKSIFFHSLIFSLFWLYHFVLESMNYKLLVSHVGVFRRMIDWTMIDWLI